MLSFNTCLKEKGNSILKTEEIAYAFYCGLRNWRQKVIRPNVKNKYQATGY